MSKFDPQKHHRRSIRLKGYDYSQPGGYFVTLVTYQREELLGEIINGLVTLTPLGNLVKQCWETIYDHFPQAKLGEFVIMPNHLHGIIILRTGEASAVYSSRGYKNTTADASPQPPVGTKPQSLGAIIQNFKSVSTRKANARYFNPGNTLWQRNYFEHIIRNEAEYSRIREYILANPLQWINDQEYPASKGEASAM